MEWEPGWQAAFEEVLRLCRVQPGDCVAVLAETRSRPVNLALAEAALHRLGARPVRVTVPSPRPTAPVAVRSTGASRALAGHPGALAAITACPLLLDLSVEGLLHAPELPTVLAGGTRILMVSNEHPELLERMKPDAALEGKVKAGVKMLMAAKEMRVSSEAGTDLTVDIAEAPCGGGWGFTTRKGSISHWPGGLCLCFPLPNTVNGRVVMAPGDINLTFKRYLENAIELTIENDYVVDIKGNGVDADLMRSYFAAWGDREAYATSHVGWGMNQAARWDAMTMYDRSQTNGTEQRAFGGNFLYSTGANERAGRYTQGHFDLPMRNCTVSLDGTVVVERGVLQGELA